MLHRYGYHSFAAAAFIILRVRMKPITIKERQKYNGAVSFPVPPSIQFECF
jgi:hypothetical protein